MDVSDMPLNLAVHLRSLTENFKNKVMTERFLNNLLCFVAVVAYNHLLRLGTMSTANLQRDMAETFNKLIKDPFSGKSSILENFTSYGSTESDGLGFLECMDKDSSGNLSWPSEFLAFITNTKNQPCTKEFMSKCVKNMNDLRIVEAS
jgi:hypothetical protein